MKRQRIEDSEGFIDVSSYFIELMKNAAHKYGTMPAKIVNPKFKTKRECKARRAIYTLMRRHVAQRPDGYGVKLLRVPDSENAPGWVPLSLPNMGKFFGVHHTTVLFWKKQAEAEEMREVKS